MELLIPVFIIISISFVGFGVGVLFFNKTEKNLFFNERFFTVLLSSLKRKI